MKDLLEKIELEKLDRTHLTSNDVIIVRFLSDDIPFEEAQKIHRTIESYLAFNNKVITLPKDIEIIFNSKEEAIKMFDELKEFVQE